jgi:hypothetical protein
MNIQSIFCLALLQLAASHAAWAQSTCSSDGQKPPRALLERFINADCNTCWTDAATPTPSAGTLALDWILPSARGDDAPLSAAASRDAVQRLEATQQTAPAQSANVTRAIRAHGPLLRVARGVALAGYIGASIELKPARSQPLPRQPLTAWLLLVEDVPAGTDGTPVARSLVRNMLLSPWNINSSLLISKRSETNTPQPKRLYESRPMSIPQGANPDRMRVVGWVEDAKGRVIAAAVSACSL